MKQLPLKTFTLLLILFVSQVVHAQRFDSLLNVLDARYPQEKIYLHFDRNLYTPGETIWFKAYLFTGPFPSQISKTMYTELLDDQGNILQRKSAPIMMSSAAAAFDLPANLKLSQVYVRAYTRWMLNFDPAFIFEKAIPIAAKTKAAAPAAPIAFLQFFPEGGNMVNTLTSRIAFKATNGKGFPINVKGDILDNTGKKITSFTSEHDGMGVFVLQPQPGQQYKAVWKDQSGKPQETVLPQAQPGGMVIEVNNGGDKINFNLTKTADAPYKAAYVVAQMHQQLLYRAKANLANRTSASGSIPLNGIPSGIIQVTVFSENEQPIAERIVFANSEDNYFITDLNIVSPKNIIKRAKNVIQIDVPDTIACNLSVSVTDAGLNPADPNEGDIFSNLLLTSDIKGYVHQPAYYFNGTEAATRHLDLVMLTNGWRRFKWEEVLAGKMPNIVHEPEGYLAINGKVSGLNKSQLSGKELTGMLETSAGKNFVTIPVKVDGTFSLTDMIFYDTAKLYFQFNNDKDKRLTSMGVFEFRNNLLNTPLQSKPDYARMPVAEQADTLVAKNDAISQKRITQEEEKRKVQTLAAVEVKARQKTKEQKLDEEYATGLFKSISEMIFAVEDDQNAQISPSVFDYLRGRVAGMQITQGTQGWRVSWRGEETSIYIDEMQRDAEALESIRMTDVALIKVFRPPFFGSIGGGAGGAIAVYSKKGRNNADDSKGLNSNKLYGYSAMREFYSPDYSKYDERNDQADYRTTLLWEPFLMTDKTNRRVLVTFYNNDITRRIRVVVEGCNVDGKLTRIEKIFE